MESMALLFFSGMMMVGHTLFSLERPVICIRKALDFSFLHSYDGIIAVLLRDFYNRGK